MIGRWNFVRKAHMGNVCSMTWRTEMPFSPYKISNSLIHSIARSMWIQASATLFVSVTSHALSCVLSEPRKIGISKPMPRSSKADINWKPQSAIIHRPQWSYSRRPHSWVIFFITSSASLYTRHSTYSATKKFDNNVMFVIKNSCFRAHLTAWYKCQCSQSLSWFGELLESIGQDTLSATGIWCNPCSS